MSPNDLISVAPESLGIPSTAVEEFLSEITEKQLCMHSFVLLRHGKIAAEGYWPPFSETRKHRMYSISKSFASIAIGMMIDEGKLSLDSKVADFFPEYLPDDPHPYVLEATVRDLLMMSTFNRQNSYDRYTPNFVKSFITDSHEKHKPGQVFLYDTSGTDTLCAIVEKLSSMPMLEYMRPVLDQIGFSKDAYCIMTPEGGSWAGSGVMCTSRDLARFALLCMNGGKWDGNQLLNHEYVSAATSRQIDNSVTAGGIEFYHGYGYQFWCLRDGGFAMYGMGSQYALCLPRHGTILVVNSDTQGTGSAGEIILDLYFKLIGKISDGPLPENTAAHARLKERISMLTLPRPVGKNITPRACKITGRKYVLDENEAGIKWLKLTIEADKCLLQYEKESGVQEIIFGMNGYEPQLFPEKYHSLRVGIHDTHYQCIGAGAWVKDNTLLGTIYSVDDHLGSIKFQLTFIGDEICGYMNTSTQWFFDGYQGFLVGKSVE